MASSSDSSIEPALDLSIQPDEIVAFLKKNLQFQEVCQRILYQRIVDRAAQTQELVVMPEEIQAEAEQMRREMHLERAVDTIAWLKEQMISADDWEAGIYDRLLTEKLKQALFEPQVESFFVQNRLNFDQVLLYQIIVPYEEVARELFYQIEENEISFYEAAHDYDVDEERRRRCGYEGLLYRWSLKPAIATSVFGANLKEIIRPIQTEQGYHLLLVEDFVPAQLTSDVRQNILATLFNEWLTGELSYVLHQTENASPSI
ncbi:MAG: peptidylprolyl isomerase [Leptolyngbyaceae cyanobacterium CSU_1_3]|nr:peptidylprolyl isomerase [Leptolyngbyaceae cyanobacterium CSU_1_3]